MKAYYEGRKEKTIKEAYGPYRMEIRYLANCNTTQVTMYDVSQLRFPLLWSATLTDEQANAALDIFKTTGFFELAF